MELQDNTMRVDKEGKVTGSAFIPLENGYYVSCSVTSYEYDGDKLNHVPHCVLVDEGGKIIHEAYTHDSLNADVAIDRAEERAERLAENYEMYVSE